MLGGENERVEFKSTLRWDLRQKLVNKKLEFVALKTLAAFLNSSGGSLILGVDDDQNCLGLDDDIDTLEKKSLDGFELHLLNLIKKYIGNEYSSHVKISFPVYEGKKICRVVASPSSSPVFLSYEGKDDFFIRSGCSSQPLTRVEQSKYEAEHWGS